MSANIWLTSDSHFWHENIYKFTMPDGQRVRREFTCAADGDAFMVEAWNSVVKPQDKVWHLGDVTMERDARVEGRLVALIHSLHGHKRLVLGNHDHLDVRIYRNAGFEKVRASNMFEQLLLTHYPVHPNSIIPRALANVHGHIHRHDPYPGRYINVSVERTGYTPIALEEVVKQARALASVEAARS